jgi:hypothetical protein
LKLKNKEWLRHQRQDLRKSKEEIAVNLNISITPVNKWLDFHGLNGIKIGRKTPIKHNK